MQIWQVWRLRATLFYKLYCTLAFRCNNPCSTQCKSTINTKEDWRITPGNTIIFSWWDHKTKSTNGFQQQISSSPTGNSKAVALPQGACQRSISNIRNIHNKISITRPGQSTKIIFDLSISQVPATQAAKGIGVLPLAKERQILFPSSRTALTCKAPL